MSKSVLEISKHTDREILMNMVPRLETLESTVESHGRRQDSLENAMISLRNDLVETENRISKKVDDRIDKVDDHLSKQDERLDDIVDSAVVRKRTWSDGKKIVVTGVITLAAAVLTGLSTGILHF